MRSSSVVRVRFVPKRRTNLRDHRAIRRNSPTVEWPEMHVVVGVLPDVSQPRNACVRGRRYPTPARRNGRRIWLYVPSLQSPAASENCLSGLERFRNCDHGQNQRKYPRRSASGTRNRQGRTASRSAIRAARSIAAEMKNRVRRQRASSALRKAAQPATQRCPCDSSIFVDWVAARLPRER